MTAGCDAPSRGSLPPAPAPLPPWALTAAVFVLAVAVSSQYGFQGGLSRDESVLMYAGQRLADGVLPCRSTVTLKGPLAQIVAAGGGVLSRGTGWDELLTVRLLFLLVSALTAALLARLGEILWASRRVSLLAAAGVLHDLAVRIFLFALPYVEREPATLLDHLAHPIKMVRTAFASWMLAATALGLAALARHALRRRGAHPGWRDTLVRDASVAILLPLPPLLAWSLLDFQGAMDFFPVLPYVALGCAALLEEAVRVAGSRSPSCSCTARTPTHTCSSSTGPTP